MNSSRSSKTAGRTQVQTTAPLLSVSDLTVEVATRDGWTTVVDHVSFEILRGEALGIVGESGAGKTMTALSVLRLMDDRSVRISEGTIKFEGRDLLGLSKRKMREVRGREIAMIFQEPMTSLNPAYTVGEQIAETIRVHLGSSRASARDRAVELLEMVGIPNPERRAKEYPHSFSGGMRQRVMIAVALACDPKLLLADEPTTALDVTVQATILDLLAELQKELGLAVVLVTHDLGVVQILCDRVLVMYAGELVEEAGIDRILRLPLHPYTRGLVGSMPAVARAGERLLSIQGTIPTPGDWPEGCRFHTRCDFAVEGLCDTEPIDLITKQAGRLVRCVRSDELDLRTPGKS